VDPFHQFACFSSAIFQRLVFLLCSRQKHVIRHDHFHIIMDIKDCGKFLSNEEASAVTTALKLLNRADKARNEEKK